MNRRKAKKIFIRACHERTGHTSVTLAKAATLVMKRKVRPAAARLHFQLSVFMQENPKLADRFTKMLND